MGILSSTQRRVLIAAEATYGVDAIHALLQDGAIDINYLECIDPEVEPVRTTIDRTRTKSTASGNASSSIGDHCTVKLQVPFSCKRGAGAGNEAPNYRELLIASNHLETIDAGVGSTYRPTTRNTGSFTIYMWEEDLESNEQRLVISTGVRGGISISWPEGEEPMLTFDGKGLYEGPISEARAFFAADGSIALLKDGTAVTARTTGEETYADSLAVDTVGMTIEVDGTSYGISALEISNNVDVSPVGNLTSSAKISKFVVTRSNGNRIGGSTTLFDDEDGLDDILRGFSVSDVEVPLNVAVGDGTNTTTLTAPAMQFMNATKGDAGGMRTYDFPIAFNGDLADSLAGDNDYLITYA